MKAVLRNKLYLPLLVSDLLSNFGDVVYYLALMNYVLLLPNPSLALSIITLSEGLPYILGFLVGIRADKMPDKIKGILGTQGLRTVLYLLVGLVVGFEPSLWIIIVISLINVVSDLSGRLENALFAPLSLKIIQNDDREAVNAFSQTVRSILNIAFQSSGAILVAWMSYQTLALFNAATFALSALVMLLVMPRLKTVLAKNPIKVEEAPSEQALTKEITTSIKLILQEIKAIPALRLSLVIVPVLNALGAALETLLIFNLTSYKTMIITSPAMTLAIIATANLVGNILGGLLAMGPLQKVDLMTLIYLSVPLMTLTFISFLCHSTYAICLFLFVMSILTGGINPKIFAQVMNNLSEEKLGRIVSGIDFYFTSGMFLVRILVAGLVLVVSAQTLNWIFVLASVCLLLYTWKEVRQLKARQAKEM